MTEQESTGPIRRLRAIPGRSKVLIAVGVVLIVIFATRSCEGVNIKEEQAIATAQAVLTADPDTFAPERIEAKILRQGFPPRPMWVVVFTVPDPDGGNEDFLHHAAVWVDASTGDVRQVNILKADDG